MVLVLLILPLVVADSIRIANALRTVGTDCGRRQIPSDFVPAKNLGG